VSTKDLIPFFKAKNPGLFQVCVTAEIAQGFSALYLGFFSV